MPVPQCPGEHVARFSLAKCFAGSPVARWPLVFRYGFADLMPHCFESHPAVLATRVTEEGRYSRVEESIGQSLRVNLHFSCSFDRRPFLDAFLYPNHSRDLAAYPYAHNARLLIYFHILNHKIENVVSPDPPFALWFARRTRKIKNELVVFSVNLAVARANTFDNLGPRESRFRLKSESRFSGER